MPLQKRSNQGIDELAIVVDPKSALHNFKKLDDFKSYSHFDAVPWVLLNPVDYTEKALRNRKKDKVHIRGIL